MTELERKQAILNAMPPDLIKALRMIKRVFPGARVIEHREFLGPPMAKLGSLIDTGGGGRAGLNFQLEKTQLEIQGRETTWKNA